MFLIKTWAEGNRVMKSRFQNILKSAHDDSRQIELKRCVGGESWTDEQIPADALFMLYRAWCCYVRAAIRRMSDALGSKTCLDAKFAN